MRCLLLLLLLMLLLSSLLLSSLLLLSLVVPLLHLLTPLCSFTQPRLQPHRFVMPPPRCAARRRLVAHTLVLQRLHSTR